MRGVILPHEWLDHHFSENRVDWAGEGRMGLIHWGGDVIEADMKETRCRFRSRVWIAGVLSGLMLVMVACSPTKPKPRIAAPQRAAASELLDRYIPGSIGLSIEGTPWIGHVKAVDLDQDDRMDVIACESRENKVMWLRQLEDGSFDEQVLAENLRAPVHVEEADMNGDGHLDLIVSSMSVVFPNNDKIGAIFILENDGQQQFTTHLIIEHIDRVVDVRVADLDGDGKLDLAVGQFGYDQGEVRWMRRIGEWEFESEILLKLSGTCFVNVADYTGDGNLDIVALVSQQWEEIHLFANDGKGNFTGKIIWGSTNEDYSLSGMSTGDINRDGRPDILFTNGDGFGPNPLPGPKPWHGVQWLENTGNGNFRFHRIGDLGGAYSPVAWDMDDDGDMDVVALSAFNDWNNPKSEAIVWFENDGFMRFVPRILAYRPTHLLSLDIADFDHSGRPTLVTGGFHAYPPYGNMSRILRWRPNFNFGEP